MAEYNIVMKQKNDQGEYDTLYPKTLGSQVQGMTLDQVSGNLNSSRIEGSIPSSQIEGIFSAEQILTQSTAALFGLGSDAVPDEVFSILSKSLLVKRESRTYGDLTVGDEVSLTCLGQKRNFVVVHQGLPDSSYDVSCNGTWLWLKDGIGNKQLNSSNNNVYSTSSINQYLNGEFINSFKNSIKANIKTAHIPCITDPAQSISGKVPVSAFLPSVSEIGFTGFTEGKKLDYFVSGTTAEANNKRKFSNSWWTRTPVTGTTFTSRAVFGDGTGPTGYGPTQPLGIRPMIIMDSSATIGEVEYTYPDGTDLLKTLTDEFVTVRIETGSYVGTGTGGQSNPNTIKTDGSILGVLVTGYWGTNTYEYNTVFMNPDTGKYGGVSPGGTAFSGVVESVSGGIEWYSQGNPTQYPQTQGNVDGQKYCYIVLKHG